MEITNEIQQSNQFHTYRGAGKCLSDGISFLTDNFTYIVKQTLPIALIFAAIQAGIILICSDSRLVNNVATPTPIDSSKLIINGVLLIILSILYMIVIFVFEGYIYRLIKIKSHNLNLKTFTAKSNYTIGAKYGLKLFCCSIVIGFLGMIASTIAISPMLFNSEGNILFIVKATATALLMLIFFVLVVPLKLAQPALFLHKGKAVKAALHGYKCGMKKWGKVFCLSLLIYLLVLFVMFILSLPSIVLINSYYSATNSLLNGDSVTLPSGFHLWYYIVLLITSYLFTFTFWISAVPYAYQYAAICSDEKEEKKNSYLKVKY